MVYSIGNQELKVEIDSLGAELISVCAHGKEMLWQNPTGDWAGHAPVIFPVCGNCTVIIDGTTYPYSFHGFAYKRVFTVVEQSETAIKMQLRSDEQTLSMYPYAFELTYTYTVNGNALEITHEVRNLSNKEMYFSMGGHESFNLDEDLDSYELHFEKDEQFVHCPHNATGMLTGENQILGSGKILPIPKSILQNSETLILTGIRSNSVSLVKTTGEKVADVCFDGFHNLLLWRPMDAKMICIEPWKTLPDTVGKQCVELSQKQGIEKIANQAIFTTTRKIFYY